MSIDQLIEDFSFLEEWEDRYRYVIELGQNLEALSDEERVGANKVHGCASQVWLVCQSDPAVPNAPLHFRGDSDAHIVRGLIAILFSIYNDKTPAEITAIDEKPLLVRLGLEEHLSPQRSNGLHSMIKRIRETAESRL